MEGGWLSNGERTLKRSRLQSKVQRIVFLAKDNQSGLEIESPQDLSSCSIVRLLARVSDAVDRAKHLAKLAGLVRQA